MTGFNIERRAVDVVDFTKIGTTKEYFFIDKDINTDIKASYIYRVYAFKGKIVSGYSNEVRMDCGEEEIIVQQTDEVKQSEPASEPTKRPATGTPRPDKEPGPTGTPIAKTEPGTVWLVPNYLQVQTGTHFTTGIHINTGNQKIAAFGITVEYSDALLDVNRAIGSNGVISGSEGFLAAVNARNPGMIFISGMDPYGKGPGEDIHLVTIQWKALSDGVSKLSLGVRDLNDEKTKIFKNIKTLDGMVKIVRKESPPEPDIVFNERWIVESSEENEEYRSEDDSSGDENRENNDRVERDDYNDDYNTDDYTDYNDDYIEEYPTDPPISYIEDTEVPVFTDKPTAAPKRTSIPTATPKPGSTGTPTSTPKKTGTPTATPKKTSPPSSQGAGQVWFEPDSQTVNSGASFVTEVHVDTGSQKLAAYGINFSFNNSIIQVDKGRGKNGVDPGYDGFVTAVNPNNPGELKTAGFDFSGKGPNSDLFLLKIYWKSVSSGTTAIRIDIDKLVDGDTNPIGTPDGSDGTVTVR